MILELRSTSYDLRKKDTTMMNIDDDWSGGYTPEHTERHYNVVKNEESRVSTEPLPLSTHQTARRDPLHDILYGIVMHV